MKDISLSHTDMVNFDNLVDWPEGYWQKDFFDFQVEIEDDEVIEVWHEDAIEWNLTESRKFTTLIKKYLEDEGYDYR